MEKEVPEFQPSEQPGEGMSSKTKKTLLISICTVLVIVVVAFLISKPKNSATVAGGPAAPAISFAELEKTTTTNPNSDNVIKLTAAYINANVPGKSFPYLKALLKKEPNNALAYNNLGVANIMLKNYMQGIEACTKAIKIDTGFQLAKNNLKWGIDERNKVLTAITQLNNLTDDKKDSGYYTQLGFDYFEVGDYDHSITVWQTGVQKFATASPVFYNNIGSALVLKKQYDAAIVNFNKVLAAEPDNQLAKNNINWAKAEAAEK